jgi:hypothetical protein
MKFKKNLLLGNYWANSNKILLKWFLDGPLPKLCPLIPTSNQDGHQAKNRKRGSQEPVIAHLVFNLTSKVDRKWGCYTYFWKWATQRSFWLKFLSKRLWSDLVDFWLHNLESALNGIRRVLWDILCILYCWDFISIQ